MTVKEAYEFARYHIGELFSLSETDQVIKILFEDLFDLYGSNDEEFDTSKKETLDRAIVALKNDTPLQYITEKANFFGYDFKVNRNVLIPRPETEELVHWVATDYKNDKRQLDIVDIGTGSGCIAITLKKQKPSFRLFAVDISIDALNIAKYNAKQLGTAIHFFNVDILEQEEWSYLGAFDIVVSNPPYIPDAEKAKMHPNVLEFEPEEALFVPDDDPLLFYGRIMEFAQEHLKDGGWLYFELNEYNAIDVMQLAVEMGFVEIEIKKDLQEKQRMIKMKKIAQSGNITDD